MFFRTATVVTALAHVLTAFPVSAAVEEPSEEKASSTAIGTTSAPEEKAPEVKATRSLPAFQPPTDGLGLSGSPSDQEIFRLRIFPEPLVPVGGSSTPAENRALAQALASWAALGGSEDYTPLETFLSVRPSSPWRVALLTNLGILYRNTGYFIKALAAWEEAWKLGKDETDPQASAITDRALAQLFDINGRLGRRDRLEELFAEIEGRNVRGSATEVIAGARQALYVMKTRPEEAFPCGPVALDRILTFSRSNYRADKRVREFPTTPQGTSLTQMKELAENVGFPMQIGKRTGDVEIPLPAMVHWKAGHFAALVESEGERYRMQDATFGPDVWLSRRALLEETTGYFLVPAGPLPAGWRTVDTDEGSGIWGRGVSLVSDPKFAACQDPQAPQGCPDGKCLKMAGYSVHSMLVSLNVKDTPLHYSPPRGPSVSFTATYNQREAFQPQTFTYANLGPKWTFDWISYVEDNPNAPLSQTVKVYRRGGGAEEFSTYDAGTGTYALEIRGMATLARTSSGLNPVSYERRTSDGSVEVFGLALPGTPRKVFMTQVKDPQGNTLNFSYDANYRLVGVTDAIGQVTTLSYELPYPNDLKITKVTDPFGRFASFEYNPAGQLKKITDVIGITSEFQYGSGDFIQSLTTPYGTTAFEMGENGRDRWLEITDPLGAKERVEYRDIDATLPAYEMPVPAGMLLTTGYHHMRNTLYWDKRAMALYPGVATKAKITRWYNLYPTTVVGIIDNEKLPLEGRVWYNYPGEYAPGAPTQWAWIGPSGLPTKIGRVLDDGSTQLYQYEYNSLGKVTRETDPLGRAVTYTYALNGIDLLEVRQVNGQTNELQETRTHNSQHLPLTITDAAGQTTTYTYDAQGRLLTVVTPPRGGLTLAQRTTTYSYDTNGQLQSITGPEPGKTATYTYDGYVRLRTVTNADGYTLTYDYDALDRRTRVTFPDGSYEETVYNRLDAEKERDRLGRWTHTFYDALRRPVARRDPMGRTTTLQWCTCGSLEKLIDGANNATAWERDVQGRVTREIRPDGRDRLVTYETTTSRVKQFQDSMTPRQMATYEYFLDSNLKQVSYTNAVNPTPTVSFTYDPVYNRLATIVDGTGTTTYTYSVGAGRLVSVDGPLANDTVSYSYDELGRVVGQGLPGLQRTLSYDHLGRVTALGSVVGSFNYTYDGVTARQVSLSYPNGQSTAFLYFPNSGDRRLQQIKHLAPGSATLSKFDYTYDLDGDVKTWTQQLGANPAKVYDLGYDPGEQLTSATLKNTATPTVTLKRYIYGYDSAGNRSTEQVDDGVAVGSFNNRNQLLSSQPGGALRFAGTANEPATVSVQEKPAQVAADNTFVGQAQVPSGTSNVVVAATDPSGNTRTNTYQVTEAGSTTTYTYDANGNLTSDGVKTFEWDAANRLVRVSQGSTELARFTYDGLGRRSQKIAGGITRSYVYDGAEITEERLSSGAVFDYVYAPGVDRPLAQRDGSGSVSYYLADHLGSVVQQTDAAGTVTLTREYDPYGNPLQGSTVSGYAYTGREWDSEVGLYYYRARYYDPRRASFISEDPAGLAGGPNLYSYVGGNPIVFGDPSGHIKVRIDWDIKRIPNFLDGFMFPEGGDPSPACDQLPCGKVKLEFTVNVKINILIGTGCPEYIEKHERLHASVFLGNFEHALGPLKRAEGIYSSFGDCYRAAAQAEAEFWNILRKEGRRNQNWVEWARIPCLVQF